MLLDSGEFDWENPWHREAYLRAWVSGKVPAGKTEEESPDDR
jgi:hypothetical protein